MFDYGLIQAPLPIQSLRHTQTYPYDIKEIHYCSIHVTCQGKIVLLVIMLQLSCGGYIFVKQVFIYHSDDLFSFWYVAPTTQLFKLTIATREQAKTAKLRKRNGCTVQLTYQWSLMYPLNSIWSGQIGPKLSLAFSILGLYENLSSSFFLSNS